MTALLSSIISRVLARARVCGVHAVILEPDGKCVCCRAGNLRRRTT